MPSHSPPFAMRVRHRPGQALLPVRGEPEDSNGHRGDTTGSGTLLTPVFNLDVPSLA